MKEQYITRYFEFRYYADIVIPLVLVAVLVIAYVICRTAEAIGKRLEEKELRRIEERYKADCERAKLETQNPKAEN